MPGFSLQQHISWALVAHDRSSHSSIWGGRGKEIRSSGSFLATREVQDSVGLHEIISEGKGGVAGKGTLKLLDIHTVPELLSFVSQHPCVAYGGGCGAQELSSGARLRCSHSPGGEGIPSGLWGRVELRGNVETGSGSGAFLDQCCSPASGAAIRLGYFRSEQKRLRLARAAGDQVSFCSWEEGSLRLRSAEPPVLSH